MAKVYYHGTSPEAAQAIEREGFKLPKNPAANGPGVYLTDDPKVAESYGGSVVKVQVAGKLAGERTSTNAAYEAAWNKSTKQNPNVMPHDGDQILKEAGFKGKTDDDGAKVVFDPQHVKFIGHHALNPAQFGGQ